MKRVAEIIEGRPLVYAEASEKVRDVAKKMSDRNVGAVAVLDSGKLVGLFSERDLMTRVVAPGLNPEKTAVSAVMTRNIVFAEPVDDFESALQKMYRVGCRHLPVVDRGNLVGMISLRDLLQIDDQTNKEKADFLNELVTYSPDYES